MGGAIIYKKSCYIYGKYSLIKIWNHYKYFIKVNIERYNEFILRVLFFRMYILFTYKNVQYLILFLFRKSESYNFLINK